MAIAAGQGWADAVSKILRMGKNNPESNGILSKAKRDHHDSSESETEDQVDSKTSNYATFRLKPQVQSDALKENELKAIATTGVVHVFNAVRTINPKSDKKRKKKKKKKNMKRKRKCSTR
jgi:hypothetical protein